MELQAQTVTMITAAVDETALAANSMSSTIAAIRSDTEQVAKDIDQVEQGFGKFSDQIADFTRKTKEFVAHLAASPERHSREGVEPRRACNPWAPRFHGAHVREDG